MLHYFEVSNFLSFDDPVRLNMNPVDKYQNLQDHVLTDPHGLKALGTAVLFGPNAAGKSNMIKAMYLSQMFIKQGELFDRKIRCALPFLLGRESNPESRFEYCFSLDGIVYTYGFVVTEDEIQAEWLFSKKGKKRQIKLFERSINTKKKIPDIVFCDKLKEVYGEKAGELLSNKTLFLTVLGTRDELLVPVRNWLINALCIIPATPFACSELGRYVKEYPEFATFLSGFLRECDTGIESVECVDEDNPPEHVKKNAEKAYQEMLRNNPAARFELSCFVLKSRHAGADHAGADHAGGVLFDIAKESDGTQQLIHLAWFLFLLRKQETVLVVDELDRSLHTFLTREVMSQFRMLNQVSGNYSQLIFTSHDTNLMDATFLRKDEIWLLSKNAREASRLTCLAEFRTNTGVNFEKMYLIGRFGGVPFVDHSLWQSRFAEGSDSSSPRLQEY
ncbi:MAG: ATP-binding protein [Thermoguttaceae bacterium]|nr:ATP-binding protein [Thermoguttaceae bacterium]